MNGTEYFVLKVFKLMFGIQIKLYKTLRIDNCFKNAQNIVFHIKLYTFDLHMLGFKNA